MKQNNYDDQQFFDRYSQMPRSVGGLSEAGEWPAFQALLPDLTDKRVLDLGCGFGWHCRHAREHGAKTVVGVDLSAKMLARARGETKDDTIEYRQSAIEELRCEPGAVDVVISSLALHYVEQFSAVCRSIHGWLSSRGVFVFSVEHPMFTARAAQDWCYGPEGERLHWPVDHYHDEGMRHTSWMADDVIKYHRTSSTYVNTLIDSGFAVTRLVEPTLTDELLARRPDWIDERRRPMFLLIQAVKRD